MGKLVKTRAENTFIWLTLEGFQEYNNTPETFLGPKSTYVFCKKQNLWGQEEIIIYLINNMDRKKLPSGICKVNLKANITRRLKQRCRQAASNIAVRESAIFRLDVFQHTDIQIGFKVMEY